MIDLVIYIISILSCTVYYLLVLSYKIGKLIIHGLKDVAYIFGILYDNVLTLLRVILEDFYVFVTDIVHHVTDIGNGITSAVMVVGEIIITCVEVVMLTFYSIYNALAMVLLNMCMGFVKIFTNVGSVFVFLKYLVVLIGSGIWFALTLIPLFLMYTFTLCTYCIGRTFEECINIIQCIGTQVNELVCNVITFVTDVPFEAIAGLLAGCCILYVILKFHIIVYRFLQEIFLLLVQLIRFVINQLRHQFSIRIYQRNNHVEVMESSQSSSRETSDGEGSADRYCVICQERSKCVLILPCKHVCLCIECTNTLRYYNRKCPICRSDVKKTMKVFV